ncbi:MULTISPECIES: hypothetical protein [Thiorhodovibrio]|uniref:hypothetical protein n=1 Tax=Thiorhodovibrio TaxID=61593 RepID=UPI00191297F4|nr:MULTISPECIES: hypothetical protein [Thiorhodovibrio]WPL14637.1 hypothetical protein Thiosp_04491 [Thiorhodovibrio litoralis]
MKILLAIMAGTLAAVLALQWYGWRNQPEFDLSSVETVGANPQPATKLPDAADLLTPPPPKEEYAAVVERTLFLPDRRPPEKTPDGPENGTPEPEPVDDSALQGLDFSGVLISPDSTLAWVSLPREPQPHRLRPGDDLKGWTVRSIEADRLILRNQDNERVFALRDYANAPPLIPPTRLPSTAQLPRSGSAAGQPEAKETDPDVPASERNPQPPGDGLAPTGEEPAVDPRTPTNGPVFGPRP